MDNHMMISEDYVSYELALLLKEKGFDEGCHTTYDYRKQFHHDSFYAKMDQVKAGLYLWAPTVQRVMKWLREKHHIDVEIRITNHSMSSMVEVVKYYWVIFNTENAKWKDESTLHKPIAFDTYEGAEVDAIKYCLEKLI